MKIENCPPALAMLKALRAGKLKINADGSIDDVRVYNRALTASKITRLYNIGK